MKEKNIGNQEPFLGGFDLQLFADKGSDNESIKSTGEDKKQEAEDSKKDENVFTQDDVNAIVARESKSTQEKIFKELGIKDFEDAKEGMEKFKEWQESQKTEAERQEERLQQLEAEHLEILEQNSLLQAQIIASKQGVKPDAIEDVVVLARSLIGEGEDIEIAIKNVIEKYPHFAIEEEKEKPKFTSGEHKTSQGDKATDPFLKKLEKYK